MNTLCEFEDKIDYFFNDSDLLKLALTHSSYGNEQFKDKNFCNERLEFLGDAVLEIIMSRYLFLTHQDMQEGELSKLRASIVCEHTLDLCARKINLQNFILLGKGEEKTGGRNRASIVSDAFEAVLGAIYLDGGMDEAEKFVKKNLIDHLEEISLFFDSKTTLQELVQKKSEDGSIPVITYRLLSESGPDHLKEFTMGVFVDEKELGRGVGASKKAAESEAAVSAIKKINGR